MFKLFYVLKSLNEKFNSLGVDLLSYPLNLSVTIFQSFKHGRSVTSQRRQVMSHKIARSRGTKKKDQSVMGAQSLCRKGLVLVLSSCHGT